MSTDDSVTREAEPTRIELSPGRAQIWLAGEVGVTTAYALRSQLRELMVSGHTEVVVDLSGVSFLDSSALGALVSAQHQVRMFRGSLVLRDPSTVVRRLLELTYLDRVFDVRDGDGSS